MTLDKTKKNYYLGIDIGGTKCAVLAGMENMNILERIQFATETNNGAENTTGAVSGNMCMSG